MATRARDIPVLRSESAFDGVEGGDMFEEVEAGLTFVGVRKVGE